VSALKSVNGLFASGNNELFGESFAEDGHTLMTRAGWKYHSVRWLFAWWVSASLSNAVIPFACSAMVRHSRASC
jgi:hypothetical protein